MTAPARNNFAPYKSRSARNIAWIEANCVVPEGRLVGQRVRLRPWQKKEMRAIYDSPTRRYILSFARKNGKTAFVGFLLLLHICGPEAVVNSQLVSTAQSRDQAAVVFELCAKMIRMNPDLALYVTIRDTAKELLCPEIGTHYRALSADAKMAHGKSPIFAIHDELGQVVGPRSPLYSSVETGMGAHEAPMSIIISTQAATDADLLSILIDKALEGYDPKVKCSLYTAPLEDDPFKVATMRKANPAYGDFLNAEVVKEAALEAEQLPSFEAEYRNLHLNQRVSVNNVFIGHNLWLSNGDAPAEDWGDRPVYLALDLSEVADLTALAAVCDESDNVEEPAWGIKPTFWLPGHNLAQKSKKDRVPYDLWADQGFLEAVPAKSIEYSFVAHRLRWWFDNYNVVKVAFDRWGMRHLLPWLERADFTEDELDRFVEFGQGFQSMSPAMRAVESAALNQQLRHGNHPVLTMCNSNSMVTSDPAGNRKLNKIKSTGRIDGMIALLMALSTAVADRESDDRSYLEDTGMLVI
ncbi:MAG: terminase large subunit [Henriciella sp.]|nr:terminase large subunit [Henriciella sp.]